MADYCHWIYRRELFRSDCSLEKEEEEEFQFVMNKIADNPRIVCSVKLEILMSQWSFWNHWTMNYYDRNQ